MLLRRTICLRQRQRILKKCLCSKQEIVFQDTQTDCIQDTAQKMKLKRLKASIATMTRQTDAEQRRPTIKKLEVKQVEFKLGEDCWEIQVESNNPDGFLHDHPLVDYGKYAHGCMTGAT
ncbi:hypothetical protein Tco_1254536 [Tanacetum coccineum]